MDNRLKRFLSLALAMVMVIGMMPANIAFATENEGTPIEENNQVLLVDDLQDDSTQPSEAGEPMVIAENCTLIAGCTLEAGHPGDCKDAGNNVLANPSKVQSAAGLKAVIGNGGTIVLAADIELTEAITVSTTVVLNLDGHKITVAAPAEGQSAPDYALINKGTLTVKGGEVAGIMNEGTLTVESGTFTASDSDTYALYNKGTATVNGGTFNAKGGQYAVYNYSAKEIRFQNAVVYGAYNAGGIMTVGSGKFWGNVGSGKPAVYSMGGRLTITGGEFHNEQAGVATVILGDTCAAEITGGTITNESQAPALSVQTHSGYGATISGSAVIKSGIAVADGGTLTINGGTFLDADYDNYESGEAAVIKVNGGTFEDWNSQEFARKYAQDGKILIFKDGSQAVKMVRSDLGAVSPVIATTGSGDAIVGYPSLAAAVAVGGTVDMVADTFLYETVEVSKAVVLNLNGCNIGTNYLEDGAIYVKAGGSLTINDNGTSAETSGSITSNDGSAINNHGALVVNGGFITGLHNGQITADTATATLNSGEIGQIENEGRMTLTGAEVHDWIYTCGVFEMTGGDVEGLRAFGTVTNPACGLSTTIKGGNLDYLESTDYEYTAFGNVVTIEAGEGNTIPEVEWIWASKAENTETKSRIDIKNGKIYSVYAYQFDEEGNEIDGAPVDGMISITGGTFKERPAEVFVKDGYEVIENQITGGREYIVQLKKVVLEDPTVETNLITNNGAGTHITRDQVLEDIRNNENLQKVTNESGYTLVISPKHVVIEAGNPYKTSRITYSVSPVDLLGNKISNPGKAITFRLPIPGVLPDHVDYANVYHGTEKMTGPKTGGIFEIEGTDDKRYVTVTSDTFSDFTVEMIDVDYSNHVAKIGVKGYASVQAAVDAVRDGETIELLALPEQKVYGAATINLAQHGSFTIDGAAIINNAPAKRAWNYDGDATITITGISPAGKTVTIKNIEFNRTNKDSGEFIKITGNYSDTNVLIENCDFKGPGSNSEYNMVAIRTQNTKGVKINGGTASGLRAFLENVGGQNLTVKNVTIRESNVGMELGTIRGVTVEGVTITSTVGKYGISMDAYVDNNAVFTSCNITAAVPVMVYGTPKTNSGKIYFNGTSTMTASSGYWIILGDEKYSEKPEGTSPESLTTAGRILITVTDAGFKAENINDKHKDESDANLRKYYTAAPEGKLESAVVMDDSSKGDSNISLDIRNLKATERVVCEIFDKNNVKIAETKLVKPDYLCVTPLTGVVEIAYQSGSWDTTWLTDEKCPTYRNVPAKAKLVVDGKVLGEVDIKMYSPEYTNEKRIWTDVEGVGNMTLTEGTKVTWKHTLAEALADAPVKDGVVTLFADNKAVLSAAGEVIGGKTVTITGEATFDWDQNWLYIGRSEDSNGTGDGTLIFDKATIHAYGDGDDMGFNVSGNKAGEDNTNNGTLKIINGSNVEVDYIVNRNYLVVDDSTLTVKHGFYVHGRKAGGNAATAVVDVTNGAALNIQNAVGATLGDDANNEGNGELNVDGSSFACGATLNIANGSELNVSGTSTLNIKKVEGKAINLLDEAVIKNSTVGGAAVAVGTAEKNVGVSFIGTNTFDSLSVSFGVLNTNTESLIKAEKIILESENDRVVIDATNLVKEKGAKVIDLNGDQNSKAAMNSTKVSVKDNKAAKRVADDGDVYVYFEAYIDKNRNGKLETSDDGYRTLAAAVAAAKDGEGVILLTDVKLEETIEIKKSITLKMNNYAVEGKNPLVVNAKNVAILNGKVNATESGVVVAKDASLTLADVHVKATEVGVLAIGDVTIRGQAEVKGIGTTDSIGLGLVVLEPSKATVQGGKISGSGEIAVPVFGGTLEVSGGTIDGGQGIAIATICQEPTLSAKTEVNISGGNVIGGVYVTEADEEDMPAGYQATVAITGGMFTKTDLYAVGQTNKIVVSGGTFDAFVPFEKCAVDYLCQETPATDDALYEVVYKPHRRVYLKDADDQEEKIIEGDEVHFDGNVYKVMPGKVIALEHEQAKKSAAFITAYKMTGTGDNAYPENMYVWYAVGKDADNCGVHSSYEVQRVEELDGFFQYHGTSIRVGGTSNGIRFFSSVDVTDANKLMNGTLITTGTLKGAKMVSAGTWFKKTNEARSEVYGGAVGNTFRTFQTYQGRNWFTGVLVGLENSAKNVAEPFLTRPFADIKVGDKTVTLYGGLLTRSIYYVATQNKDIFADGSSYDNFVENLIKMGYDYLHPTTPETPAGGNS